MIVYVRNYHNVVKKYCLEALNEKKKFKPYKRSLISLSVSAPLYVFKDKHTKNPWLKVTIYMIFNV